jgi:hypothetical protein
MRTKTFKMLAITLCLIPLATSFAGPKNGGGGGKGGKDTTSNDTALCVSFRDAAGDDVFGDLPGIAYCNQQDNIKAVIGQGGRFALDTSDSDTRNAIVNYPDCHRLIAASGSDCVTDIYLNTLGSWESTGMGYIPTYEMPDLVGMAVGDIVLVDFQIAFPSSVSKSTPNLVIFGGSNLGTNACGEPVPVYHIDEDTWIIEATGQTGCLFEVYAKNGKRRITDSFSLTFAIILTRL